QFGLKVMLFDGGTEPYLFYIDHFLVFARFLFLLLLLIAELAIIHDSANRRFSRWSHIDQVQIGIGSQLQSFPQRHNSKLFPCSPYNPHLFGANFPIHQMLFVNIFHLQKMYKSKKVSRPSEALSSLKNKNAGRTKVP